MPAYVAEISGRGVVAFDATDDFEARTRLAERELLRDLRVFQNEGRPIWDGVSAIALPEALPEEIASWRARRVPAANVDDDRDMKWVFFLVRFVDPSRFADGD